MSLPIDVIYEADAVVYAIVLDEDGNAWVPSGLFFEDMDGGGSCADTTRYAIELTVHSCIPALYQGSASVATEGRYRIVAYEQTGTAPDLNTDANIGGTEIDYDGQDEINSVTLKTLLTSLQSSISSIQTGGALTPFQERLLQSLAQRRENNRPTR